MFYKEFWFMHCLSDFLPEVTMISFRGPSCLVELLSYLRETVMAQNLV